MLFTPRILFVFSTLSLVALSCDGGNGKARGTRNRSANPTEVGKLGGIIGKKKVSCTPVERGRGGAFSFSVKKKSVKFTSQDLIAQAVDSVEEVLVGADTVLLEVTGVDSDEGTAVVIFSADDLGGLQDPNNFFADVLVYGETGPGDGSAVLVKFTCAKK